MRDFKFDAAIGQIGDEGQDLGTVHGFEVGYVNGVAVAIKQGIGDCCTLVFADIADTHEGKPDAGEPATHLDDLKKGLIRGGWVVVVGRGSGVGDRLREWDSVYILGLDREFE